MLKVLLSVTKVTVPATATSTIATVPYSTVIVTDSAVKSFATGEANYTSGGTVGPTKGSPSARSAPVPVVTGVVIEVGSAATDVAH